MYGDGEDGLVDAHGDPRVRHPDGMSIIDRIHLTAPASQVRPSVQRLPRPRASALIRSDAWILGAFIVAVTLGLWWQHGGIETLLAGGVQTLRGIGQVTGLSAALAALGAIVLTARPRQLERRYGLDRMLAAHRWFGIVTVLAVVLHAVVDTWAWAAGTGTGLVTALGDLLAHQQWMVAALVGTLLFVVIGLTSYRRIKAALSYETWYFVHTLGYLAVLLAFGHQLTLGTDFTSDTLALVWWCGLAIAAVAIILWSRLGGLLVAMTRRFYVVAVSAEADRTRAIHVSGPGLASLRAQGGQFFFLRPLVKGLWWQAHPISVSAAPTTAGLRFTVKELGDDTPALVRLRPGTRVVLEGPYGVFTADQARGSRLVLVAGGVGVGPIRAILEDCHPDQAPIVIVRVHDHADLAHRVELEQLVAARNGTLHVLAGPRAWFAASDPFAAATLAAWIPDLAQRHAFVCGPRSLESAVTTGLRKAGMPTRNIHHEQFGV